MEDTYLLYVSIRVIEFGNILKAHFDPLQQFLLIHDRMEDITRTETECSAQNWKNTASSMSRSRSCNTSNPLVYRKKGSLLNTISASY